MKTLLASVVFALLSTSFAFAPADSKNVSWKTDFEEAKKEAKKNNKYILLNFTGSDWCGWCMRLNDEVFSQPAFVKYAAESLVCVKLDFPRNSSLVTEKERQQNHTLQQLYQVQGYPTIILLSPDGAVAGVTGYQRGGAKIYIEHLNTFVKKK